VPSFSVLPFFTGTVMGRWHVRHEKTTAADRFGVLYRLRRRDLRERTRPYRDRRSRRPLPRGLALQLPSRRPLAGGRTAAIEVPVLDLETFAGESSSKWHTG